MNSVTSLTCVGGSYTTAVIAAPFASPISSNNRSQQTATTPLMSHSNEADSNAATGGIGGILAIKIKKQRNIRTSSDWAGWKAYTSASPSR